uniref:DNA binding protein n=1 Tax=Rhizophora mucronata TaxID=61149 RepID=A0A2P2PX84_RHIMU
MVPNSRKKDKASMLDEVIDYLKQLRTQVQMMSRMNMQSMMLPMGMHQQMYMSMMASMSFGMGMGMDVMDRTPIAGPNIAGIPPVLYPTAFTPMTSWDGSTGGDHRLHAASATVMPDQLSAFLACQSQPMTMDAYRRMAAPYQQLIQQQLSPNFRS